MLKISLFQPAVRHGFVNGVYLREMSVPRGTAVIGYMHREPCINLMTKGRAVVWSGGSLVEIKAPWGPFTSPPESRKMGVFLEDSVFVTIHPNPEGERDVPALEKRLISDHHYDRLGEDVCKFGALLREKAQEALT